MESSIIEFLKLLAKVSKNEMISTETLSIKHLNKMVFELESNNKKLNEENIKMWLVKNKKDINNFSNRNIGTVFDFSTNNHSKDSINYINEQEKEINKTIYTSFINVYNKLEKENNLKKLFQLLGDLEFE